MVARRLEDTPDEEYNKTHVKINKLSQDTLKGMYLRKWKILLEDDKGIPRQRFSKMTEVEKVKYIIHYPEDSVPNRLKHYLTKSV